MTSHTDPRLIPPLNILPDGFEYPATFFEYLRHYEKETASIGVYAPYQMLWPARLGFMDGIIEDVKKEYGSGVVPFARDNGDRVWFFAGDGIYIVDLGWSTWRPQHTGHTDFTAFINEARRERDLPGWRPRPSFQ